MTFEHIPIGRSFKYGDFIFQKLDSTSGMSRDGTFVSIASISGDVRLLPIIKESRIEIVPIGSIKLMAWHKPRIRRDAGRLEADIAAYGVMNPLTITGDGFLIDGWYRYQACVENNITHVPVHRV